MCIIGKVNMELNLCMAAIGCDMNILNILPRHLFHPNRLPYAALRRIPDAAAVQLLLAVGFIAGIRVVPHGCRDDVFSVLYEIRDVKTERPIPAVMRTCQCAVAIYGAVLIHRAEMQQQPIALLFFQLHLAFVPKRLPGQQLPFHAGKQAFG